MKFKHAHLAEEFARVHPETQHAAQDLDAYCRRMGYPEVVVTQVQRTREQMRALYVPVYMKQGHTEEAARALADGRFSWHLCRCALDLRAFHYSMQQREDILRHLQQGRTDSRWEVLLHSIGAGIHFHLARRDFTWRRMYAPVSVT